MAKQSKKESIVQFELSPKQLECIKFHILKQLILDENKKFKITPAIFKQWDRERGILSKLPLLK